MPSIAIVGAGFGGLAAAIELKRAGIDTFTVFERGDAVGGVWRANTYPGAACDVPSEIYSFSYALKADWSRRFGFQAEIQRYLEEVADRFDLRRHLRFGVEVRSMRWSGGRWRLELAGEEEQAFDAVICATGQLSRPKVPELPGRDEFRGAQFHSAEWKHDVDLRGRRVAVVGSGASAVQIVPAIADAAAEVTVVQRSPNWIIPKYDWATTRVERVLNRVPGVARLRHLAMWWKFETNYVLVPRRLDPIRKVAETRLRWLIRRRVGRELAAKVTPDYPLGCNRVLLSSQWYPTLAREDVRLVASGVERVTPDGLECADGSRVEADAIVWCTGFTPTEYLAPMRIVGRDGRDIHELWKDGPEAYLGISMPGFPNLFMSYGPNTGSLTNTVIFLLERQAAYVRQALQALPEGGWIDVREEVHRGYNAQLQERMQTTVFTAGCPGWYTTEEGKVTTVFPGPHVEYARLTRRFDPGAYEHGVREQAPVAA